MLFRKGPSYPAQAGYPVRRGFSIHHGRFGILDHPPSRVMTAKIQISNSKTFSDASPHPAARCARVVHERFAPKNNEGVGNAGCPIHPQPRVRNKVKHTSVVTTGPPGSPGIPARNGFNGLFRALPGDEFVLSPSSAD